MTQRNSKTELFLQFFEAAQRTWVKEFTKRNKRVGFPISNEKVFLEKALGVPIAHSVYAWGRGRGFCLK